MRIICIIVVSAITVFQFGALLGQESTHYNIEDSQVVLEELFQDEAMTKPYGSDNCKWDLYHLYSHLKSDYNGGQGKFNFLKPQPLLEQLKSYQLLSPTVEQVLQREIERDRLGEYQEEYGEDDNWYEEGISSEIASLMMYAALYDQLNDAKNRGYIADGLNRIYPERIENFTIEKERFVTGESNLPEFLLTLDFLNELTIDTISSTPQLKSKLSSFFNHVLEPLAVDVQIKEDSLNYILLSTKGRYHIPKSLFGYLEEEPSSSYRVITNSHFYQRLIPYLTQVAADYDQDYKFGLFGMNDVFEFVGLSTALEEPYQYLTEDFNVLVLQVLPKSIVKSYQGLNTVAIQNRAYCSSVVRIKSLFLTGAQGSKIYVSTQDKLAYIEFVNHYDEGTGTESSMDTNMEEYMVLPEDLSTFLTHIPTCNYSKRQEFGAKIELSADGPENLNECLPHLSKFLRNEIEIDDIRLEDRKLAFRYEGQDYSCRNSESYLLETINKVLQDENSDRLIYRLPMNTDQYLHLFYLTLAEKEMLEGIFGTSLKFLD